LMAPNSHMDKFWPHMSSPQNVLPAPPEPQARTAVCATEPRATGNRYSKRKRAMKPIEKGTRGTTREGSSRGLVLARSRVDYCSRIPLRLHLRRNPSPPSHHHCATAAQDIHFLSFTCELLLPSWLAGWLLAKAFVLEWSGVAARTVQEGVCESSHPPPRPPLKALTQRHRHLHHLHEKGRAKSEECSLPSSSSSLLPSREQPQRPPTPPRRPPLKRQGRTAPRATLKLPTLSFLLPPRG
jgi:hypothetical protein